MRERCGAVGRGGFVVRHLWAVALVAALSFVAGGAVARAGEPAAPQAAAPDPLAGYPKKIANAIRNGERLTEVDLSGSKIRDLTPLKGLPLRTLDLTGCKNLPTSRPSRG